MPALTVPFLAACLLLAVAGTAKLRHPDVTVQALRTQGLPSAPALVTALGVLEIGVAAAGLLGVPGAALLVGAAYAGFTAFVVSALVRGRPLSSCGCFAEPDVPPSALHAVLTGLLAAGAVGSALSGRSGVPALGDGTAGTAVVAVASAALVAWLALLVLTALPRLAVAPPAPAALPEVPVLPAGAAPAGATLLPLRSATP